HRDGADRAAGVPRGAGAAAAGLRLPLEVQVVQGRERRSAVARGDACRAGRRAAGAHARRAGRPAVRAGRPRPDRSGPDPAGGSAAATRAAAGGRAPPVLRVQPLLGVLVSRSARGAARLRGDGGARAALGARGAYGRSCSFWGGAAPVGAIVPDHRLVGRDRAVEPIRVAVAALCVAPAGSRGATGTSATGAVGVITADVACLGAWRLPGGRRAGGGLLRARARDPAARDDAEPGAGRQGDSRTVLVGRVEAREPGAAAWRGGVRHVRRLGRRRLRVVYVHRAVGERAVRGLLDGRVV